MGSNYWLRNGHRLPFLLFPTSYAAHSLSNWIAGECEVNNNVLTKGIELQRESPQHATRKQSNRIKRQRAISFLFGCARNAKLGFCGLEQSAQKMSLWGFFFQAESLNFELAQSAIASSEALINCFFSCLAMQILR